VSARPPQHASWIICPLCKGDGHVDALGVVNPMDFDAESFDFYKAGGYDVLCANCKGTGKVREDQPQNITRIGSDGQQVQYADADDASEHFLRMSEGWT
jgi:RecJ-like exonuclease